MGIESQFDADLLVIGGGINGAGIARDATGRGLRVVLCEKGDLAQATSSASTKLIHGGLRYLEHYEFSLVRAALKEREVLLHAAPHIIWPLRFVLPHHQALRPRWLIRLGLFLYDHLAARKTLPASHGITFASHVAGKILKKSFTHGFVYSDCWVQDARLVVLNARDAQQRGAQIRTRCECVALNRHADHWSVQLRNTSDEQDSTLRVRAVVNAAGPWVDNVRSLDSSSDGERRVRLVKGSHVIVPRLFEHEYPYIFQNADGRVLFAIPYENDFTLLGTTDQEIEGDPAKVHAEQDEVKYICAAISEYLQVPIDPASMVSSYSGVRPLLDDESENASKVTRDYVLDLNDDAAPILSVIGGKITTFRKLSERAVTQVCEALSMPAQPWTEGTVLPGGDLPGQQLAPFIKQCEHTYPLLPGALIKHYATHYGTHLHILIADAQQQDKSKDTVAVNDLGEDFGAGLYEAEVRYLMRYEWAISSEDILWRRTKKGLHIAEDGLRRLAQWLEQHR